MDNFFDKFKDKLTDSFYNSVSEIEKLNKELEFYKVPDGVYRVEVVDMVVKQSRKGNWMIQTLFKVLSGRYECSVFPAYMIVNQRNIESNNEFLKSLGTALPIECKSITQYQQLVDDVFITIRGDKEYDLEIKTSPSGFSNYKILKDYIVEHEPLPFVDD